MPLKPDWKSKDNRIRLFQGDCTEVIKKLPNYDLIFADPPFNIGQNYSGYHDSIDWKDYVTFTHNWIWACWQHLSPTGVMALHGPDNLVELYLDLSRSFKMSRIACICPSVGSKGNESINV